MSLRCGVHKTCRTGSHDFKDLDSFSKIFSSKSLFTAPFYQELDNQFLKSLRQIKYSSPSAQAHFGPGFEIASI